MNKKNKIAITLAVLTISIVAVSYVLITKKDKQEIMIPENSKVTVYKSPTCGCCVQYISYLKKQGYEVETVSTTDTASIKRKYGIFDDMESCHTADFGNYFVEGHIPIKAIGKLLAEKPEIDGIALPEMPSGSPGMPGLKLGPFEIYGLKNGVASSFMNL